MATATQLSSAAETPLIGRHEAVEEILSHVQRARDGVGRVVLLMGPGGVGKSTFLRAAAAMGRELGFAVLEGRSTASDLPAPFQLVQALLRSAQVDRESRERAPAPPAPTLPMFLAPFESDTTGSAARSTGLAEPPSAVREANRLLDHLADPAERVDAHRSAFFTQLSDFFLDLSDERPLLLLLDDLPFADDSSLEFFVNFVRSIEGRRIVVLASLPPPAEFTARSRPALEQILAGDLVSSVALSPMSEAELSEYVRWLLRGRDPGRDLVMRWFSQTQGNPLFTEYLVRASMGAGRPTANRPEASQDFGEVLRARVRELPEPERRLLVYGAALGREFDFPTVAEAAGGEEERLSESLDRLVHDGILREKGGEVYEFVSERLRADVYAQLTETRRRLLHRRIARGMEARAREEPRQLFELARQFYLGRDDEKAVEYNRGAAELAAKAFAFDTAVAHLERALESIRRTSPRDLPQEVLLLIELGRHLDELGDLHRSETVLLDAVARARSDPDRPRELALALLGLAQTRSDLTQYLSSRDLATEAFGILERLGHERGLLAAHRVLGVASWRMGDLPEAERHQRAELALAQKGGSDAEVGHALIDLANTFTLQTADRAQEAMGLYEQAAQLFARSEDHSARARVLMNHALLLHYARRPDEALQKMRDALSAAERSRSRIWIGYCCLNLGQFLAERGQLAPAREHVRRAQELLEPLDDRLAHQQLVMIRGMIATEDRAYDEADGLFHEAARLAKDLDLGAEAAEMEYRFADLESRRGRLDEARRHIQAARAAGIERLRADLLPKLTELIGRVGEGAS